MIFMSEEVKNGIVKAWNRYLLTQQQRFSKNEGSSAQHEDAFRMFKEGIKTHGKLSQKEKTELLMAIGQMPPA